MQAYGHSPYFQNILRWVTLACITFLVLHVSFCSLGWYGNDDINYARWAAFYADKGYLPLDHADHFSYRWFVVFFTGIGYHWFGVTDGVSLAVSLISTLLVVAMLYKHLQRTGGVWLVLVVFSLQYTVVFYAHRLLPDSAVMMLGFAAYLFYRSGKPGRIEGALASLALFMAFLAKETVVLMAPVWLGLMAMDLLKKRVLAFWKGFSICGLVLLATYLWYFHAFTGDAFQRWHALQTGGYFNECSYDQLPAVETWKRVSYGLWLSWLRNGDLLILTTALVAWVYRKKIFTHQREFAIFGSFPLWILAANFMTVSFRSYVPMCPDPRHFLFIMPFAAYGAGYLLEAFRKDPHKFPALPLIMAVVAVAAFVFGAGQMRWLYLLWAAWLGLAWWWKGRIGWSGWWMAGLIAVLLARPSLDFIRETYPAYGPKKALIRNMEKLDLMPGLVWTTNAFDAELCEYLTGFKGKPFRFSRVSPGNGVATYLLLDELQDAELTAALRQKLQKPILQRGPAAIYLIDPLEVQEWLLQNMPK
jgi:hypothetical protein